MRWIINQVSSLFCAALVQQVINLLPQQIDQLPPEQKAQVLAIQQQLVS